MRKVTFIPQYEPWIRPAYARAAARQILSGWVGPSGATEAFEKAIARAAGLPHAVATTSGTAALMIALKALDIPAHSTILFPAYTFLAGANAARFLGFRVRLVDIREETLCMDPDKIAITPDVGAVMFVNHNGYAGPDAARVKKICARRRIPLIEDASQGLGIRGCGATGDIAVFSFSVPKLVTTGQGGALVTRQSALDERIRRVVDHGGGWRGDRIHRHLGVNFKFNDILASFGLSQIQALGLLRKKRRNVYRWYRREIDLWPVFSVSSSDSPWMMIHKSSRPEAHIAALKAQGIQAVQYYKPVAWNPVYRTGEKFPVADKVYREALYLPSSLNLTQPKVKKICRIVKNAR